MLNEHFDKVYLINLDKSIDRLEKVTKACEKVGIEFERVKAIPGTLKNLPFTGKETEGWNKNAAGLTMTTINILNRAIQEGRKNIFILEDDANFTTNFNHMLNLLMRKIPANWDFIHLNMNHKVEPNQIAPCVVKINKAVCCQAYGINRTVMKEYRDRLLQYSKPIDEHTADLHEERNKSFGPSVNIVYHVADQHSTLRDKIVKY